MGLREKIDAIFVKSTMQTLLRKIQEEGVVNNTVEIEGYRVFLQGNKKNNGARLVIDLQRIERE